MNCPVCGKQFDVLWPNQWAYKRNNVYICSYGCMQMLDQRKEDRPMANKLTKEQHAEVVRIALAGGNVKQFLKECGSKNPDSLWCYLKKKLMVNDPETYEKLAGGRKHADNVEPMKPGQKIPQPDKVIYQKAQETVETPEGGWTPAAQVYGTKDIEIPEKQMKPVPPPIEYKVTGISTAVGNFSYLRKLGYIDWTNLNGETVSMNLEEWKELMKVWPFVLKVLEVEL